MKSAQEIQRTSAAQIKNNQIKEGLATYKQLQFLYPGEKQYYINYLNYLAEEFVIAELLWEAYEESLKCCTRAIVNLTDEDIFYFHIKKIELIILMTDQNYSWFETHQESVLSYIEKILQLYPENFEIQKRLMALYKVMGKHEEAEKMIDKVYAANPNDFSILILKIVKDEKNGDYHRAISILEQWLNRSNATLLHKEIVYKKLIDLYEKTKDHDKIDYYQDLLDNL